MRWAVKVINDLWSLFLFTGRCGQHLSLITKKDIARHFSCSTWNMQRPWWSLATSSSCFHWMFRALRPMKFLIFGLAKTIKWMPCTCQTLFGQKKCCDFAWIDRYFDICDSSDLKSNKNEYKCPDMCLKISSKQEGVLWKGAAALSNSSFPKGEGQGWPRCPELQRVCLWHTTTKRRNVGLSGHI